jgi:hypothetical protein
MAATGKTKVEVEPVLVESHEARYQRVFLAALTGYCASAKVNDPAGAAAGLARDVIEKNLDLPS